LPLSDDADASAAVEQLLALPASGIKIRTRALTTTLFARLVLSDLFLHGIGGARYDQVTDQIIRDFFDVTPPEFAAVSATLRLPIGRQASAMQNGHDIEQRLRELRYHPERFIDSVDGEAAAIVASKQQWVRTSKTPDNARERHEAIAAANQSLQPFVASRRTQLERQREDGEHFKRVRAILDSRDYSFCLFPREHFERLLLDEGASRP
jgi:hypothetical protein